MKYQTKPAPRELARFDKSGIVLQKGTSSGTYQGKPFQTYEWSSTFYTDTKDSWKAIQTANFHR